MENKQADRSPFEWRDNTASERRRMRNQRKKRKRLQRRKGNDEFKLKTDAVIDDLARRLRKELEQNRRLLFLARKYYLKWKTNKDLLIREKSRKLTSTLRNTVQCYAWMTIKQIGLLYPIPNYQKQASLK